MKVKSIRYKAMGGPLDPYLSATQMAGQLVSGIADLADPGNEYGTQSVKTQAFKGAVQAGVPGLVIGALQGRKALREDENRRIWERMDTERQANDYTRSALSANPSLLRGSGTAFYAMGGPIRPLNSKSTEVVGPSHEQGGVELPGQSNVEGKETISNGFVFSDRLGFAEAHKKLAKMVGKIEAKPLTAERINSLRRLQEQEQLLMQGQELLKKALNIPA